jgi:hypothetical protein
MSEPSELEYAWSIAEARNERLCQVLEDNLALLARVAKLETLLELQRKINDALKEPDTPDTPDT